MASTAVRRFPTRAVEAQPPVTLFSSSPTYQMACDQLRKVAELMPDIDAGIIERLTVPKRSLVAAIPIRMDDGTTHTFVGYRVQEKFGGDLVESTATGRTTDVTGSMTITGTTVPEVRIEANLAALRSDRDRRDNALKTRGLQTDQFPTATFRITEPVEVPTAALSGTPSDVTLVGDLTLHGVTRSVEIPAQAQLADGRIQVAGSITFPLSDRILRTRARQPRSWSRRAQYARPYGTTSTGRIPRVPSMGTSLSRSTSTTTRAEAAATIFSLTSAPP